MGGRIKLESVGASARNTRNDGQFIFSVWDRIEDNEFTDVITQAAARFFPDDPPMFLKRTPHGYYDATQIERELRSAGFRSVVIHKVQKESRAANPSLPAFALCQGTLLRNEILSRDPSSLQAVTDKATDDMAARFGHGEVVGKIQALVCVATK